MRLTPAVLSEVEATLQAALVDLAGALTIRNGRLVRPLSHSGFGRRPRVPQPGPTELRAVEGPSEPAEDGATCSSRTSWRHGAAWWVVCGSSSSVATDLPVIEGENDEDDAGAPPAADLDTRSELRRAEEELAAAETAHWQAEFELADAEGAMEAAEDRVSSLDTQRIEARRDKVTAQRYLTQARSQQRDAVKALAEARGRLDAARRAASRDE